MNMIKYWIKCKYKINKIIYYFISKLKIIIYKKYKKELIIIKYIRIKKNNTIK